MEHLALDNSLVRYRSHFPGPHLEMVVASIIAGNTVGELWASRNGDTSPLLLLWDRGNNNLYLAGDAQTSLESFAVTIAAHIRPRAVAAGRMRFKVRALPPLHEDSLQSLFPGTVLRPTSTLFFVHHAETPLTVAPVTPPGVALVPITLESLTSGSLAHSDDVLDEIHSMWPSEDCFDHHGFGSMAVLEDDIICWCTAEYMSPTSCGIGVATMPQHQRRGIATATAMHVLAQARARGITAYWECDHTNYASIRVAEKVGFQRQSEEEYWLGRFER